MALIIISLLVVVPLALLVWDTARRSNGSSATVEPMRARSAHDVHGTTPQR